MCIEQVERVAKAKSTNAIVMRWHTRRTRQTNLAGCAGHRQCACILGVSHTRSVCTCNYLLNHKWPDLSVHLCANPRYLAEWRAHFPAAPK